MFVKICPKCNETKSLDDYYKSNNNKDGIYYPCKTCCKLNAQKYHKNSNTPYYLPDEEKINAYLKKYLLENQQPEPKIKKDTLTQTRLKELFLYDPFTGNLIRRIGVQGASKGAIGGHKSSEGYLHYSADGKKYLCHRLVWLYVYGYFPEQRIIHNNKKLDDNRIKNLSLDKTLTPHEKFKKLHGKEFIRELEKTKTDKFFTLTDIGKKYNLSRERVRQIFEEVYGEPFTNYYKKKIKQYKQENPNYHREYAKKFREKNKNNKEYLEKTKITSRKYYEQNKEKVNATTQKWRNSPLLFNSPLVTKISWRDYTECSENGHLITKCTYCGKKFIPKTKSVIYRERALNSKGTDTQSMYCSSGCKKACPTFHQKKYYKGQKIDGSSREVQPELRQMCLERDNYTCQKCGAKGKTVQLHCHHIYPLNESPITSADVDNTITLCKSCHKEAHKIPGCNNFELRCSSVY